jgi:hypothetical protein
MDVVEESKPLSQINQIASVYPWLLLDPTDHLEVTTCASVTVP